MYVSVSLTNVKLKYKPPVYCIGVSRASVHTLSSIYSLYSVQDAKNILLNLSEKMGLQSKKHGRRFFFPLLSLIVMLLFSLSFLHYTINLPLSLSLNDIGPPNFFSFHSFLLPYPLSIMQLWCCYPFSYGSLLLYELYANRDQL